MNKFSSIRMDARKHIWGASARNKLAQSVPKLAKKEGRIFWNSNRKSILMEKNVKRRFENAELDRSPIILPIEALAEKSNMHPLELSEKDWRQKGRKMKLRREIGSLFQTLEIWPKNY